MDWFSWLSKSSLERSIVYEYGLTFTHNQLEEDDIAYFNHEFLQSMGISIAKHRLEILKLVRKEKLPHQPMSRLLGAIKKTKRYVSKYMKNLIHREDHSQPSSAIVLVSKPGYSQRWKNTTAMVKNKKKTKMVTNTSNFSKQKSGRLLLTNGSPYSSPLVYDLPYYNKEENNNKKVDSAEEDDDGYWSSAVEEIRWDTMFQDLKPT
ncbi:hypothetical protein ACFE04_031672 [Oxalis oulophora]